MNLLVRAFGFPLHVELVCLGLRWRCLVLVHVHLVPGALPVEQAARQCSCLATAAHHLLVKSLKADRILFAKRSRLRSSTGWLGLGLERWVLCQRPRLLLISYDGRRRL